MNRLRLWWLARKYGVCRTHLTLMRQGGVYESKWICGQCITDNQAKNTHREEVDHLLRVRICEQLRAADAAQEGEANAI